MNLKLLLCNLSAFFLFQPYLIAQIKVIILVDPECPISQYYVPIINNLTNNPEYHNVQFKFVVPAKSIPKGRYKKKFKENFSGKNTIVEFDKNNLESNKLGATITPQVFVFNVYDQLIYEGAIDNKYEAIGKYRQLTTANYLLDALQAALLGELPAITKTTPIGCIIEY